ELAGQVVRPVVASWARHVYWMYTIYLREGDGSRRDAVMASMDRDGIETRPVFFPMHVMPPYRENAPYPVADLWAQRGINLPTHCALSRDDVTRIVDSLRAALQSA